MPIKRSPFMDQYMTETLSVMGTAPFNVAEFLRALNERELVATRDQALEYLKKFTDHGLIRPTGKRRHHYIKVEAKADPYLEGIMRKVPA